MLPILSRLPSSFLIVLTCEAETPERPAFIAVSTHPEHMLLQTFLVGFVRLAPVLKLPDGRFTVVANLGRNAIAISPRLPSAPLTGFLTQLAAIGADDLAEIRRQVEGYPYDRIASEYERLTLTAKRTRRVLPTLELDATPLLPVRVVDVLGGPATTIRLSPRKDVIRLRGVPFNQTFARLANDTIFTNTRAALRARLPIIGNPRHVTASDNSSSSRL